MTAAHPRAVGTYGWAAIKWIETELNLELRWWQRLAVLKQLEHDQEGRLVWKVILETTPRRSGKSLRLRGMALWRIAHPQIFGEEQIVLHTGRDVAVVREIHRKAWRWAMVRKDEGWSLSRGVGQEEVINDSVNRWLVRSTGAVYGYDVCCGMVDEAWDVQPEVFTEGLEPATLERISPQLALISTAHRRATSLMKSRIISALEEDDGETLLLWWGAPEGSDISDPATWKAASPHWSPEREHMLLKKFQAAERGEQDPQADDPDPMAGFAAQYCNQWLLQQRERPAPGQAVVTESEWGALLAEVPPGPPSAVAIEAWFSDGVSLVEAWNTAGVITVRTTNHATAASAAAHAAATGVQSAVLVGKSLVVSEPSLRALWHEPAQGTTVAAARELGRLSAEGFLRHDGSSTLTEQALALRVQPAPDGVRLVSKSRADAVKATCWAVTAAKTILEPAGIF